MSERGRGRVTGRGDGGAEGVEDGMGMRRVRIGLIGKFVRLLWVLRWMNEFLILREFV